MDSFQAEFQARKSNHPTADVKDDTISETPAMVSEW